MLSNNCKLLFMGLATNIKQVYYMLYEKADITQTY